MNNSAVQFTSLLATHLPPSPLRETLYLCLADRINICICSNRDPTACCGRSSSSLRRSSVFGLEKIQLKTNTPFRSIDNAEPAGRERWTFLSISANILGDSGLNVIIGEITVSHALRGVDDWLLGWTLILQNSPCYCGSSAKCISQNSKAQVWHRLNFHRRFHL